MKLKRFVAKSVHGYLNFDIVFNGELTLLTGKNGSGKTTILNAIVALITPSLHVLADLDFELIRVELEHESRFFYVEAKKIDIQKIEISTNDGHPPLTYRSFLPDQDTPNYKQQDLEQEYYREVAASKYSDPVMQSILQLPTPMFLGLDRRHRSQTSTYRARYNKSSRNVFSPSLSTSLEHAADLAVMKQRDILIALGEEAVKFRNRLLLSLLSPEDANQGNFAFPTAETKKQIARIRSNIESLPDVVGISREAIIAQVAPFFESVTTTLTNFPPQKTISKLIKAGQFKGAEFDSFMAWMGQKSKLDRFENISEQLELHNKRRNELTEPTDRFLRILGRFLGDSGKEINFDKKGYLSFSTLGFPGDRAINSLSSGEAQIFVILSHLFFNEDAAKGNMFIVDEPELSLHIEWQELFIESIREANPQVQYILATHSPSIILDKIDSCINIGVIAATRR